ncbi:hypothetical protein GBAR_LOCUS3249 [Geodia barretti]|uniref:Fibrillar collagen NC1 domain-containing protein n=1 Tax=Geodia barretti TaxID=519541 RepID=A0AA35W0S9_GEOBA|nr:hypothetical protein GBAR_LOCUS3249 [Geodia barretti]
MASATSVVGTVDGNDSTTECVSQEELASVKAEMERRVDQLHSQLHYRQNVTVGILKDHCSSTNTGGAVETGDTVFMSTVFNITQNDADIIAYLEKVNQTINERLDSLEDSINSNDNKAGSFLNPAHNCSHILHQHPQATSGHYWVQSSPGYVVKMFCDMERVCGCDEGRGEGGGWVRVANINMTRPNENCPAGFRKVTDSGKTMCGGQSSRCISTTFSSQGLLYSRVCGKIIGYQFGRTNGLLQYISDNTVSIDTSFVDGIVLTHGSPRAHIWTFVAGHDQISTINEDCPCNSNSFSGTLPPYIGNDYFCDSAHTVNNQPPLSYLTNDPLWDGAGCVSGSCCTFNSPPWFCKNLSAPTTDAIELRICLNDGIDDEDVLFEIVELYVQ